MTTKKEKGLKVTVNFISPELATEVLRNVTKIHYNYQNYQSFAGNNRVAFESDIHDTSLTCPVSDIKEFEATLETKIAKDF